jgi:hypothetical protein
MLVLMLAASGIAMACAFSSGAAQAQDAPEPNTFDDASALRGDVGGNGNRVAGAENDAEPSPESLESDVIPQEEGSDEEDRLEEERRRRERARASGGGGGASAGADVQTANDGSARRKAQQRRKGSAVNALADAKDKKTKAQSVRGVKALEKPPNTAVNATGEFPAPLGLSAAPQESEAALKRKKKRQDERKRLDRYAPLGVKAGSIIYFPSVSTALGYDTNPSRRANNARGSVFNRTAIGLRLDGDFGDARLRGDINGSYDAYFDESSANRPQAEGTLGYEADIGRDTTIEAGLRLRVGSENITDPDLPVGASGDSLQLEPGVTLGVTQRYGRTAFRLRGTIDRDQYTDVSLVGGTNRSQEDRNATQFGVSLRAGHEVSPGFQPFVEIGADRRIFDQRFDRSGLRRASYGADARAGFAFDIEETITGEIAAGYGLRQFDDPLLGDLDGFLVSGRLGFAATPLTTLSLGAESALDDTTVSGSSGAVTRTVTIGVEHDLLRNLQVNASLALAQRVADAGGDDITVRSVVGAEYRISPEIVATGSYNYERQWAGQSINDYDAHSLLFGVRLQR